MTSLFDKINATSNLYGLFTPKYGENVPTTVNTSLITDETIDKLGESVSQSVGATTQKIVSSMTIGKFEDLGAILTSVSLEAGKLDPASIQKGGIVGWWQRNFTDVKAKLTMQLKTADGIFKDLESKIGGHIIIHQQWVRDLESLYMENYQHYLSLVKEIDKADTFISHIQESLNTWSVISADDAEAAMKVQQKRDVESRLNRLRIKKDNLLRLKTLTETNSPKIRGQQETSRATISTLKDVITQTIPVIQMEFAMFLQTLDSQKSVELAGNVRDLATKTLTRSADSAKMAALNSAKALNAPVITTQTLEHIRSRMLETVNEVKMIERQAEQQRQEDAKLIANSQRNLLTALQSSGSI